MELDSLSQDALRFQRHVTLSSLLLDSLRSRAANADIAIKSPHEMLQSVMQICIGACLFSPNASGLFWAPLSGQDLRSSLYCWNGHLNLLKLALLSSFQVQHMFPFTRRIHKSATNRFVWPKKKKKKKKRRLFR